MEEGDIRIGRIQRVDGGFEGRLERNIGHDRNAVWRKLTDNPEKDNAVLQKYLLEKLQISPREHAYGVIYVNGSHALPNPVVEGEQTKVRLIEEAFHAAMWAGE